MRYLHAASIALALSLSTGPVLGHESWVEPERFMLSPGEVLSADIRVGQMFEGTSYAYAPGKIRRFDLAQGDVVAPVRARVGDRPALNAAIAAPGLTTVIHVSTASRLTYESWESFNAFLAEKDAAWVLEEHAARGLPQQDVTEIFSRYSKALVSVGDGAGQDRARGLLTEIVAMKNPYTDDLTGGLPVQVLYQGQPRGDAQVEVFERAPDGTVVKTKVMTDKSGLAEIEVAQGHDYLIDSVVMRQPPAEAAEETGAMWESLWASLTLTVPE